LNSNPSNYSSKKTIATVNKMKPNVSAPTTQKKTVNNLNSIKKPTKHEHEPIKNQKAEHNKEAKLKAIIVAQEKKDEEEHKRKENKEKEREEERKNMKKDIEKKKMTKNQNEDFKIEWLGGLKNEDVIVEKGKDDSNVVPVNKPKSKTETHKKGEVNKSQELDKKTRLTRDQLKQMKVFYIFIN